MLIHYSDTPIVLDRAKVYDNVEVEKKRFSMKPDGLWVSARSAWEEWCRAEDFRTSRLAHAHKVDLNRKAKILRIKTATALRLFSEAYEYVHPKLGTSISVAIRWHDVVKEYDGIIIAPYIYECRFDMLWYYGWDCASGCIWNLDAIKSITLLW